MDPAILDNNGWVRAAAISDVPEGAVVGAEVGGVRLALYNINGAVYATAEFCTHARASLTEGFVEGDVIECPLHQARFHIPTGAVKSGPTRRPLTTYPVLVDGGDICVRIDLQP